MANESHHETHTDSIQMPTPTYWPLVLAFGLTLLFSGLLLMGATIGVLGGVLAVFGTIGWFRQVLPHERHEMVAVEVEIVSVETTRRQIARVKIDESHRARLPVETYSVFSGIKGGLAGGAAMIVPALLYGLLKEHSIWYPINLLGGAGVAGWKNPTTADIAAFHWNGLIIASIIQLVTSILVGLLYGAMLPIFPRRPILLGGIIAPLLWTGLLHSFLDIVNPFFSQRIEWGWFLISQVAFGLVAGWVVSKQNRIHTGQYLPFAARMGLETPGLMHERHGEDGKQ